MHLIFVIISIILIYVLQKNLYHRYWKKGLSTRIRFDREYMECGEEAELGLTIVNDKALPLPVLHFKFSVDRALRFKDMENSVVTDYYHRNDAFSVLSYQKIKRSLAFTGSERGFFRVESVNVTVRDFFLSATFAETRREDQGIYVFPRKVDPGRLTELMRGRVGELPARRSLIEDPLSFRGLRDYQPGDPRRSINMKQSARTGKWKVNLYEVTLDARVRILINLDTNSMIRADVLLEQTLSLASSIARHFLSKKERVSLWSNGMGENGQPLNLPGEGAEMSHAVTIDKYLAEIMTSTGKDAFLEQLRSERSKVSSAVLYLVISPYYKEDLLTETDQLLKEGGGVVFLVPYYRRVGMTARRSYLTGWEVDDYAE